MEGKRSWGHEIYNAISREFLSGLFSVLGICWSVPGLSAVSFGAMWVGQLGGIGEVTEGGFDVRDLLTSSFRCFQAPSWN
jgi:hypothetical protein